MNKPTRKRRPNYSDRLKPMAERNKTEVERLYKQGVQGTTILARIHISRKKFSDILDSSTDPIVIARRTADKQRRAPRETKGWYCSLCWRDVRTYTKITNRRLLRNMCYDCWRKDPIVMEKYRKSVSRYNLQRKLRKQATQKAKNMIA